MSFPASPGRPLDDLDPLDALRGDALKVERAVDAPVESHAVDEDQRVLGVEALKPDAGAGERAVDL